MAARPQSEPLNPAGGRRLTTKGERTRARILDAALELFRERGYDATTMRAVAEAAGVSVGNAYYYYPSKEALIQGFYGQVHDLHVEASAGILESERRLLPRLRQVMRAKVEVFAPYHEFSRVLFRTAGDPRSPLNPFSEASRPVRDEATEVLRQVVEGSSARIPRELRAELPDLLWVYSLGVTAYWVHDDSPGFGRTYQLIDRSTDLIVRLIKLASNPLLAPVRKLTVKMVREALGKVDVPTPPP